MCEHRHENEKLVTIAEFEHDFEAEMARIALENAKIECSVVGGDLVANLPTIEPIRIELQVFEPDAEHAKQVLAEALAESDDDADDEMDDAEPED